MSTITSFVLSSALYALIPVLILVFGTGSSIDSLLVLVASTALCTVLVLPSYFNARFRKAAFDSELIWLAWVSNLGFTGFVYFVSQAAGQASPLYTLVIVEAWPIVGAILYPLMRIGGTKPLGIFDYVVGLIALVGLASISVPQFSDHGVGAPILNLESLVGLAYPVLAMLAMALSSSFKALYTQRAYRRHGIGPAKSFFLMYNHCLPLMVFVLPIVLNGPDLGVQSVNIVTALVVVNVISAILFSVGTLKIKRSSDLFIWFFTPVFSTVFFLIWTGTAALPIEIVGIALIVGSNLLASLDSHGRMGYRYSIICLMAMGLFCVVVPHEPMADYYDALAVLAIFSTVTLAFMLERVSERSARETEFVSILLESGYASNCTAQMEKLRGFVVEKKITQMRRRLRALDTDLLGEEGRKAAGQLVASRCSGLHLSNLFSISATTLVICMLAIFNRPIGWQHDMVALVYIPSMVYGIFYLLDLNSQRFPMPFRYFQRGERLAATVDVPRVEGRIETSAWSIVLIVFLVACFASAFYLQQYPGDVAAAR